MQIKIWEKIYLLAKLSNFRMARLVSFKTLGWGYYPKNCGKHFTVGIKICY